MIVLICKCIFDLIIKNQEYGNLINHNGRYSINILIISNLDCVISLHQFNKTDFYLNPLKRKATSEGWLLSKWFFLHSLLRSDF